MQLLFFLLTSRGVLKPRPMLFTCLGVFVALPDTAFFLFKKTVGCFWKARSVCSKHQKCRTFHTTGRESTSIVKWLKYSDPNIIMSLSLVCFISLFLCRTKVLICTAIRTLLSLIA